MPAGVTFVSDQPGLQPASELTSRWGEHAPDTGGASGDAIDRLVRDPHRAIIREVQRESDGDLLRTPRPGPTAVLATSVTPPDPAHLRTRHRRAVRLIDGELVRLSARRSQPTQRHHPSAARRAD